VVESITTFETTLATAALETLTQSAEIVTTTVSKGLLDVDFTVPFTTTTALDETFEVTNEIIQVVERVLERDTQVVERVLERTLKASDRELEIDR